MFSLPTDLRLLHRHGDEWGEVHEVEHHDAASHDPERALWKSGTRIYRCEGCDEEWIISPGDAARGPGPG